MPCLMQARAIRAVASAGAAPTTARIGGPAATAGVPTGLIAVGLRGAARRVGSAEPGGDQRIKTPGMA